MTSLIDLTPAECETLLRAGVLGRLVLLGAPDEAEILPVNYTTLDDAILVRTAPGSLVDRRAPGAALLFEVDHIDHERHHGWSVVARGIGERVPEEQRADVESRTPGPPRWLHRDEWVWLRLPWDRLSGRRVGQGWDPVAALPVRRATR